MVGIKRIKKNFFWSLLSTLETMQLLFQTFFPISYSFDDIRFEREKFSIWKKSSKNDRFSFKVCFTS